MVCDIYLIIDTARKRNRRKHTLFFSTRAIWDPPTGKFWKASSATPTLKVYQGITPITPKRNVCLFIIYSGGWGYYDLPVSLRYARGLGVDCVAMTGKFHTSWGDFHSFKTREGLEYECFRALAYGARCSIGYVSFNNVDYCTYFAMQRSNASIRKVMPKYLSAH